jgi:hypothetical protein
MRGIVEAWASEAGMGEVSYFVAVYGVFIHFVFCVWEGLRGRVWFLGVE